MSHIPVQEKPGGALLGLKAIEIMLLPLQVNLLCSLFCNYLGCVLNPRHAGLDNVLNILWFKRIFPRQQLVKEIDKFFSNKFRVLSQEDSKPIFASFFGVFLFFRVGKFVNT